MKGDLNMERTNAWVAKLLQEKGVDIFRMKGVLSMAGCDDKCGPRKPRARTLPPRSTPP